MNKIFRTVIFSTISLVTIIGSASSLVAPKVLASTQNSAEAARVSFTFDDGNMSAYTLAAPTLAKYGLTGTSYVPTGCVGMITAPNTCKANENATYMTWDQVVALQNTYGWEVGSHTVTHPLLASSNASIGQPNVLTPAQVDYELSQSKADLAAHGIDAKSIATPSGDYNSGTLAQIAKYYESHRGYADTGYNWYPYSDYFIRDQQVRPGVSVAMVESYIDYAIANNAWLVLTLHDIKTVPATGSNSYDYSVADLDTIAAYVQYKQAANLIKSVNVSDGLVKDPANMLTNSSFNDVISTGWTTNNPTAVSIDTATNGSYPDATNAIKLESNGSNGYLFSSQIAVDPSTKYLIKNYLSVKQLTAGEVSFYIDEYDSNGNWISGQYKGGERSVWTENYNVSYKPSSNNVAKASLQIGVPANSGILAYYDNPQWFAITAPALPVHANLVANGTFDGGIANGWTTNSPTTIVADSANNGSSLNPANSINLNSAVIDRHLFSPLIGVANTSIYTISSYLDIRTIASKEVGFYIDEYDSNGNWISGQYKTGARTAGKSTVTLAYLPSSANVANASLQIIVSGNAGISAYLDDVMWYKN